MHEKRFRAVLVIGAYAIAAVVLATPAALFLVDRGVALPFAIPLGFALANIALTLVMIPISIVAAVRAHRR